MRVIFTFIYLPGDVSRSSSSPKDLPALLGGRGLSNQLHEQLLTKWENLGQKYSDVKCFSARTVESEAECEVHDWPCLLRGLILMSHRV